MLQQIAQGDGMLDIILVRQDDASLHFGY